MKKAIALFGFAFSDTLINFIALLFMIFILTAIIPKHIDDNKERSIQIGKICAELSWDNERDVDLDLWGQSPTDSQPVGYTNKNGENLDLYRDVLGFTYNPSHQNLEIMCAKEVVPGEWTFNVNYYKNHNDKDPKNTEIEATMVITVRSLGMGKSVNTDLYSVKYVIKENEEKTMFDFRIGEDGKLIPDSINTLFKPLRNK